MKKLFAIGLSVVLLCFSFNPAFAEVVQADTYYTLYNPLTGEYTSIAPEDYTTGHPELSHQPLAPAPRYYVRTFQSYSQSSYTYDYEYKEIGMGRLDNKGNPSTASGLYAEVSYSGSTSAGLTLGVAYGAEVNAIVATVKSQVNGSASLSVSWTKGTKYSANTTVPSGKVGYIWAYVIAVHSNGTATYNVLDTSTDQIWSESKGIGGLVPTNNINLKVQIKNS